jgi:hypothetical protein
LLVNMANDLLAAACQQEREVIDEKLYFEVFALNPLPVQRASQLASTGPQTQWLVEGIRVTNLV